MKLKHRIFLAGVSLMISALLGYYLTKPFKRLLGEIRQIDVSKKDFARLDTSGWDEFSFIRRTINDLLEKIESYQARLSESGEKLRVTLMSIRDGVISVDNSGRVILMNPAAEALTGWKLEEAQNRPIEDVFRIVNEYTREPQNSPVRAAEEHAKRVGGLCRMTGSAFGLPPEDVQELETAGELHDVGKIVVDAEILNKGGPLTDDEWAQVMRHPETGYRVLGATGEYAGIAEYVLSHHERWDGRGYPRALKAGDISWKARVIAVADAYDAMTSIRPYRNALSPEEAAGEIRRGAGTQFDPVIARVFVEKVLGLEWAGRVTDF